MFIANQVIIEIHGKELYRDLNFRSVVKTKYISDKIAIKSVNKQDNFAAARLMTQERHHILNNS